MYGCVEKYHICGLKVGVRVIRGYLRSFVQKGMKNCWDKSRTKVVPFPGQSLCWVNLVASCRYQMQSCEHVSPYAQVQVRFRFIIQPLLWKSTWISCLFTFLLPGTKHLHTRLGVCIDRNNQANFHKTGIIKLIFTTSAWLFLSKKTKKTTKPSSWHIEQNRVDFH